VYTIFIGGGWKGKTTVYGQGERRVLSYVVADGQDMLGGTWKEVPSLKQSHAMAAAVPDPTTGKLYIVGGADSSGVEVIDTAQISANNDVASANSYGYYTFVVTNVATNAKETKANVCGKAGLEFKILGIDYRLRPSELNRCRDYGSTWEVVTKDYTGSADFNTEKHWRQLGSFGCDKMDKEMTLTVTYAPAGVACSPGLVSGASLPYERMGASPITVITTTPHRLEDDARPCINFASDPQEVRAKLCKHPAPDKFSSARQHQPCCKKLWQSDEDELADRQVAAQTEQKRHQCCVSELPSIYADEPNVQLAANRWKECSKCMEFEVWKDYYQDDTKKLLKTYGGQYDWKKLLNAGLDCLRAAHDACKQKYLKTCRGNSLVGWSEWWMWTWRHHPWSQDATNLGGGCVDLEANDKHAAARSLSTCHRIVNDAISDFRDPSAPTFAAKSKVVTS
jgi:hypothetical protein